MDAENGRAEARASISGDAPEFADHFPRMPLLPGSVLIELAAQVAGPLAEEVLRIRYGLERWAMLGMIREAKLLRPAPLPATVHLAAHVERVEATHVIARVNATMEGSELLRADLWMMMQQAGAGWEEAIEARRTRLARWKTNV
jgi:3-hydroxymyristoyl/3-hydroxydecanoyl-(acyl carrier protein) dehydratase